MLLSYTNKSFLVKFIGKLLSYTSHYANLLRHYPFLVCYSEAQARPRSRRHYLYAYFFTPLLRAQLPCFLPTGARSGWHAANHSKTALSSLDDSLSRRLARHFATLTLHLLPDYPFFKRRPVFLK